LLLVTSTEIDPVDSAALVLAASTTVVMPLHSCAAQFSPPELPMTEMVFDDVTTWPAKINHAGLNPVADGPAT